VANKEYKYFLNDYLGSVKTKQKKTKQNKKEKGKPAFYATQNTGILIPLVGFAPPPPPMLLAKLYLSGLFHTLSAASGIRKRNLICGLFLY
jgi:hypothetical protein